MMRWETPKPLTFPRLDVHVLASGVVVMSITIWVDEDNSDLVMEMSGGVRSILNVMLFSLLEFPVLSLVKTVRLCSPSWIVEALKFRFQFPLLLNAVKLNGLVSLLN